MTLKSTDHFQCLTVSVELAAMEPSSIENDVHGIEKLPLKTQVSLTSFLHSEVNQLIQHIIMQDQDGQNNNTNNLVG